MKQKKSEINDPDAITLATVDDKVFLILEQFYYEK